jgi:hypothetical protein
MTQTLADRVSFIEQAERRLSELDPGTEAWRNAQRVVVHARADYWNAMRRDWDLNHPRRGDDGDLVAPVVDAPRGRPPWW